MSASSAVTALCGRFRRTTKGDVRYDVSPSADVVSILNYYYLRLAIKYDIAFWRLEEPQMTLDKSGRPNPAPSLVPWHLDAPQSPWVWLWVP